MLPVSCRQIHLLFLNLDTDKPKQCWNFRGWWPNLDYVSPTVLAKGQSGF
jgi:hypothetical protein